MDLEELRAFLNVVETGSFLAAADTLGVSRTTLRRRVEALEARAGVPLLKSTRQGVVLTDAGQMLARRGRIMVQETSALLTSIREVGQGPSGVLRVVMPVGAPPHLFAPLFGMLRSAYPQLRLHSRFSGDPLGEHLDDVDMAIHFGGGEAKGPWLSHSVLQLRELLLASAEYLAQKGTPRSIEELRRHELFSWEAPGDDVRVWPTLEGAMFKVEPTLIAADIHLIRQCCIAGLGIGLVPDLELPDPGVPEGTLVPVLNDVVGRTRTLWVSVPEALAEIPKIKMVLMQVRRFLSGL
jgi:DNA-binding transcriptional LysR family regulator